MLITVIFIYQSNNNLGLLSWAKKIIKSYFYK